MQHKGLTCSLPVYWQFVPGEKKLLLEHLSDLSQDFPVMHWGYRTPPAVMALMQGKAQKTWWMHLPQSIINITSCLNYTGGFSWMFCRALWATGYFEQQNRDEQEKHVCSCFTAVSKCDTGNGSGISTKERILKNDFLSKVDRGQAAGWPRSFLWVLQSPNLKHDISKECGIIHTSAFLLEKV